LRAFGDLITFLLRTNMKKSFLHHSWAIIAFLAWSWGFAASTLPFDKIRSLYKEGEFEKIRVDLEGYLRQSGKTAGPKEKIFAYKYLGVIYAAEPQGYPLAETYFYQLLNMAPNAHLSDLYVSSAVEGVFAKTRDRFQKENRENSRYDEFGNPRAEAGGERAASPETVSKPGPLLSQPRPANPGPRKNPQVKAKDKAPVWPWIVGVGVAGAVGGYFWYATRDKPEDDIIDAR
jgi:hypothetical protein